MSPPTYGDRGNCHACARRSIFDAAGNPLPRLHHAFGAAAPNLCTGHEQALTVWAVTTHVRHLEEGVLPCTPAQLADARKWRDEERAVVIRGTEREAG